MTTADPELLELLNEYVDGRISRDALGRLEALLQLSDDARCEYRRFMRVHAGLHEFVDELSEREHLRESGEHLLAPAAAAPPRHRWRPWWLAVAAGFVIALFAQTRR
ncbi:MAG TPA: hypothetical protein VM510_01160, partial [Caulifigura sp.]|nr:hypothetical protein [Caulifigura sp.]